MRRKGEVKVRAKERPGLAAAERPSGVFPVAQALQGVRCVLVGNGGLVSATARDALGAAGATLVEARSLADAVAPDAAPWDLVLLSLATGAVAIASRADVLASPRSDSQGGASLASSGSLATACAAIAARAEEFETRVDTFARAHHLPPRKRQIVARVAQGTGPEEVADALGIQHNTVRGYLTELYKRCRVPDRAALVSLFWQSTNLLPLFFI